MSSGASPEKKKKKKQLLNLINDWVKINTY